MKLGRWHKVSIQTLIATTYSFMIVLLISIIGFMSFLITTRTVEDNTNDYVLQLVNQINYDIEYYLKNIESTLITIKSNEDIYNFFSSTNPGVMSESLISNKLNDYLVSRQDAANIFLVKSDGSIIVNDGNFTLKNDVPYKSESWYTQTIADDFMKLSNSHIQNLIIDRYKWVVSCSTRIMDEDTNEFLGVIMIDLNFNLIDDMLNNLSLGDKGYMFIIDEQGEIIYHPKHELIYSGIRNEAINLIQNSKDGFVSTVEDNRKKNYIVSTSKYSGWKVVGAVYEDEINPYESVTKQIYTLMVCLSLALAILISIIISRNFLYPIKDLRDAMSRFKHGDLDTVVAVKQENEFGELADSFNDMTKRIKNLVITNKQAEHAKRKFELKSLQDQINPHFLYNTLDSIVWMAEAEMNQEVVEMTDSLAKLFRISINRGSEFVTIAQELEHIESYLKIQKLRYGYKLNYNIQADLSLLHCRIIKIIIQPIVENAIYHGIKKLATPGMISINVKDINNNITIIISDNGVGMESEVVKKLLDSNVHSSASKGGIGVNNVDQRIKLYYGKKYGVTIESVVFEGTTVTLSIPKEYTKEEENEEI